MPYRADEALACPHCDDAVLSAQTVQWIERYACSGCDGVWFDRDALAELADDQGIVPFAPPDDAASTSSNPRLGRRRLNHAPNRSNWRPRLLTVLGASPLVSHSFRYLSTRPSHLRISAC